MAPTPQDVIVDPASGHLRLPRLPRTGMREHHRAEINSGAGFDHFHNRMFHGFDFDNTMLRIGSMNMLLHGVENPTSATATSLAEANTGDADTSFWSWPTRPSPAVSTTSPRPKTCRRSSKPRRPSCCSSPLFLRLLLKPGGRAAVIVPDGVLFGSTRAQGTTPNARRRPQTRRRRQTPSGVFKPYAGVSTAILVLHQDQLRRHRPRLVLRRRLRRLRSTTSANPSTRPISDVLERWAHRDGIERDRARTEQSFTVPRQRSPTTTTTSPSIAARDRPRRSRTPLPGRRSSTNSGPARNRNQQGLVELRQMLAEGTR